MSRLTFENRWECPSCRDQLLKVSIEISTKIEILGHKPCRDFIFWTVENVLPVEINFWKPSRLRVSIETMSRQIETPRAVKMLFFCCSWLSDPRRMRILQRMTNFGRRSYSSFSRISPPKSATLSSSRRLRKDFQVRILKSGKRHDLLASDS